MDCRDFIGKKGDGPGIRKKRTVRLPFREPLRGNLDGLRRGTLAAERKIDGPGPGLDFAVAHMQDAHVPAQRPVDDDTGIANVRGGAPGEQRHCGKSCKNRLFVFHVFLGAMKPFPQRNAPETAYRETTFRFRYFCGAADTTETVAGTSAAGVWTNTMAGPPSGILAVPSGSIAPGAINWR